MLLKKANSVFEPNGPSGRSLSRFLIEKCGKNSPKNSVLN